MATTLGTGGATLSTAEARARFQGREIQLHGAGTTFDANSSYKARPRLARPWRT
jgi:hypothetical protein